MKSIWIEYGLYGNAGNFDSHFPSSSTCSISHYLSFTVDFGFWWSCGFWFLVLFFFFFEKWVLVLSKTRYCALCFAFSGEI